MTTSLAPTIDDLALEVTGPVLTPENPDYAAEVAAFNVAYTPRPAVVVGATDTADIAAAVRWAAASGLRVAVQATGHGLTSDLSGTVLISTRRLTDVSIDPAAATATVGAGARWRAVIDAAAPFGLAPLNGSSSAVGVVGYTLGGGIGLLSRRYGFAADHVRSLTVVTADGRIRNVDGDHDQDLFWAIRGGKVGFGVVAQLQIGLVPVTRFFGGGIYFAGADAATVLHAWRSWAPTLPDEATTSVALLRLPPDPQLPPPLQGQFVVHLRYAHIGDAAAAERLIAPMRAAAPAVIDALGELPYPAVDAVHMDPTTPMPCYDHGLTLRELTAASIDALLAAAGAESGSAVTMTEIRLLGGKLASAAASPNAVAGRDAAFAVYVLGVLAGPPAPMIPGQVEAVIAALAPWRASTLANFSGHGSPAEFRAQWTSDQLRRLAGTARQYDPQNLFGGREVFTVTA